MKNKHGGARKGSGRKKKEPTVTLAFRVLKSKAEEIKARIKQIIKSIPFL